MKSKSPSFLGSFCVSGENNSGDEFGSTLTLRSTLLSETFIIQWCIHMCAVYVVYMIGSSERENFTFTLESQLYSCSCWCLLLLLLLFSFSLYYIYLCDDGTRRMQKKCLKNYRSESKLIDVDVKIASSSLLVRCLWATNTLQCGECAFIFLLNFV